MAGTTTKLGITWTTTAGDKTVTATSVTGDMILVVTGQQGGTYGAVSDNDGGTYTEIGTGAFQNTSASKLRMFVRNAFVASGKSTIYTSTQTSSTGGGLAVFRITGLSRTPAQGLVRASGKQENQAAGTPAPAFPQAALTTSNLFGAVLTSTNGSANCAIPSGWATEDYDQGFTNNPQGIEIAHRDGGDTSTTITFGAATPSVFASLIAELDSTSPNASVTPSAVAAVVAVPAPTISIVQDASVSPTVVAAIAAVPTAAASVSVTATPSAVAAVAAVPTSTETGSANVVPTTVAGLAGVAAPSESGSADLTTVPMAAVASVLAPSISADVEVSPALVAAIANIGSPSTSAGAQVFPDAVAISTGISGSTIETTVASVEYVPRPEHLPPGRLRARRPLWSRHYRR